jgi:putative flippase GtrA
VLDGLSEAEAARFLRFGLVGGLGFVVDTGLLAVLHHGLGVDPFTARLISIVCAAVATWRMNRALTFGASNSSQAAEGLRYAAVAAAAAGINYAIYALALLAVPGLPPVAAVVVATLLSMVLSYFGYSRLVFGGAPATLGSPRSQRR